MSRSRRKTSICGITTMPSDKEGKQAGHRATRRINRARLKVTLDGYGLVDEKLISSPWDWPKDGKQWFDVWKFPEGMRK